jgi:hypothetical protein
MSLIKPDADQWREHRGYSKFIADLLITSFTFAFDRDISRSDISAICDNLFPYAWMKMCRHQRVRMFLLMAISCAAGGGDGPIEAIVWLDTALDIAVELDDVTTFPHLFLTHANAEEQLMKYASAAEDLRACIGALMKLRDDHALLDLALEQDAFACLARVELMRGEFDSAADCLAQTWDWLH